MTSIPEQPPLIPVKMLSGALAALGVYAEVPTDEELAAAERAEGTAALTARLANALYGSALAHVMTAEYAASQAGVDSHRQEWFRAAGADPEGVVILLHYAAIRQAGELKAIAERMPAELGIVEAAAGAARALKLLLEVCTVRRPDDPRFDNLHTNLVEANSELYEAGDRLEMLLSATADAAGVLAAVLRAG